MDSVCHLDASLNVQPIEIILRFCVNFGLYLRKLGVRLSQNTALGFTKCERQLKQGPQWLVVALYFLSQLVVSVRSGCDLQLRRGRSGWQL